jgi:hypothetical protein
MLMAAGHTHSATSAWGPNRMVADQTLTDYQQSAVFSEIGLEIKQKGPFPRTSTMSLPNGSYGYLPTARQHALGGYETWLGTSCVEIDAAPKIVRTLLAMFNRLK